ncbi:hypothetical protein E3N88_23698 [Mikania micrantha]|uniref:Uncharacterized protein n=1 Tax=Mikania micrantha TaxID=192012 RepID=A0A5N6NG14_9ASTR|nr:hypothetical protein E3N88_23698 [Mikania micrantha]
MNVCKRKLLNRQVARRSPATYSVYLIELPSIASKSLERCYPQLLRFLDREGLQRNDGDGGGVSSNSSSQAFKAPKWLQWLPPGQISEFQRFERVNGRAMTCVTPGVGWLCLALRADGLDEAPDSSPARIAYRGRLGSGVPPGLNFKPNKLVLLFWAHSCPFLDCRTSFVRRLDSIGQLLAIIDL